MSYKSLYQKSLLEINGLISQVNNLATNPIPVHSFKRAQYTAMLAAKDMILCANRYVWKNLPINMTSQELESLFYRFGSLCAFMDGDEFIISRYATIGRLNTSGRLDKIQPIDFAGEAYGQHKSVLSYNGNTPEDVEDVAVIFNDYTCDYANVSEQSRGTLNLATTIQDQVTVYQQLITNIFLSLKKAVALCDTEEQKRVVEAEMQAFFNSNNPIAVISGRKKGSLEERLEMWNFDNNFDTQNYCQQIDFYDKVRRSFNGIPAPDTFEKKERKITSEAEDTSTHTNLVLMDGYLTRRNALELMKRFYSDVEAIQGITVEINPALLPKEPTEDDRDNKDEEEKSNNE